jgi:signal transduction histidine kinase
MYPYTADIYVKEQETSEPDGEVDCQNPQVRAASRKMSRFKLQFVSKFNLAFATLMLSVLAITWFYQDSVKWYEHDVQRLTLANDVLKGYQKLSSLTFMELNALSKSVSRGNSGDLSERGPGSSALREAVSDLRQGIAKEVDFVGVGDASEELAHVVEIERLVEEIIRTSERIEQALREGRTGDARNELETFRNSGVAEDFSVLTGAATAGHAIESQSMDRESTGLSRYITRPMSISMGALVLITLFFIFVLSRNLTRAVNALHQGALALRNDDLSYRVPDLSEPEFQSLGEAFNIMASQLSEHRRQLHNTTSELEAMVEERTRELQESNRKLAAVDLNRRELLANISHEFRTPLTVIRGEAEIALRGSDKTSGDHEESFRRIVDQADNTTRLVDDLLFIARAEAGEPRLKFSSVAIAGMVDSVCQEFSAKAANRGIIIEQGRIDTRASVQGDAGRLRQVFAILLENALRYSYPGGRVEIQVLQDHENVKIIFRDEGIGLTEEEAELAFQRFYRAPEAVEKAAGTGLGLSVAKAIVVAHHGVISLSGKPGQGATATVVLPFGRPFGIVT